MADVYALSDLHAMAHVHARPREQPGKTDLPDLGLPGTDALCRADVHAVSHLHALAERNAHAYANAYAASDRDDLPDLYAAANVHTIPNVHTGGTDQGAQAPWRVGRVRHQHAGRDSSREPTHCPRGSLDAIVCRQ